MARWQAARLSAYDFAMLLDRMKLRSVHFQIRYAPAFELWDEAGAISRAFSVAWGGLKVDEGQPNRVTLKKSGVVIRTELDNSLIALDVPETVDIRSRAISEAVSIWKERLKLETFSRISMRVEYVKTFPSLSGAADAVRNLGLVNWPMQKVFGQDESGDKNNLDCSLRFEDASAFSVLRTRAESVRMEYEIHPDFAVDESKVHKELHRMVLDFDRGTTQPMKTRDFSADEWLKGYFHLLRRDLPKVIQASET